MNTVRTILQRSRSLFSSTNVIVAAVALLLGMSISYIALQGNRSEPAVSHITAPAKQQNQPTSAPSATLAVANTPSATETGYKCLLAPSLCGYPDETNTGVPAGVTLTLSGPINVTPKDANATTIIENKDIKGSIVIKKGHVIIRNSRIDNTGPDGNKVAAIRLYDGTTATVEDTDIDAGDAALAIGYRNYTLKRVDIKGGSDALRADGGVTVTDSYIHDLNRQPESHNDILQTLSGSNVTIRHNTLMPFKAEPGTCGAEGDPMNAAYQFGSFNGNLSNVLVENNLVNGGNYTFNANWKKVDDGTYTVTNVRIVNNKFGRDYRYGAAAHIDHGMVFEGNKYIDDGSLVDN
jgi:hypothetical protein